MVLCTGVLGEAAYEYAVLTTVQAGGGVWKDLTSSEEAHTEADRALRELGRCHFGSSASGFQSSIVWCSTLISIVE